MLTSQSTQISKCLIQWETVLYPKDLLSSQPSWSSGTQAVHSVWSPVSRLQVRVVWQDSVSCFGLHIRVQGHAPTHTRESLSQNLWRRVWGSYLPLTFDLCAYTRAYIHINIDKNFKRSQRELNSMIVP